MKHINVKFSARRAAELIGKLRALSEVPLNDHLQEETMLGYMTETLPTNEMDSVYQHLIICAQCSAQVEDLLVKFSAWEGKNGSVRLAALREKLLPTLLQQISPKITLLDRLSEALEKLILLPGNALVPGYARAATSSEASGQSEDGTILWYYGTDENNNLVVRISSFLTELEGVRVWLYADGWRHEMTFTLVAPDQVGAEALIPKAEASKIDLSQGLHFELAV